MLETDDYTVKLDEALLIVEPKRPSPVIFSVPHDGLPLGDLSGFFKERKVGWRGRDKRVWRVMKDILLATRVNVVRGLLPRALVDYNRAWPIGINYYPRTQKEVHTALDDARLASAYKHYHATIDRLIEASIGNFRRGRVLLVDLHGFSKQPPYAPEGGYDLILGTGNRKSVPNGNIDQRLASYMTDRGYKVFLPKDISIGAEEDYYSADFTTRHHSEKHMVNVLQIEIASRFRISEGYEIGRKLSSDFADFIRCECLEL